MVMTKSMLCFACLIVLGQATIKETIMRKESGGPVHVAVDRHDSFAEVTDMDAANVQDKTSHNPCSSIGCNSNKCEWASGGQVARLVAKKTCRNAKILGDDGKQEQSLVAGASGSDSKLAVTTTLKECLHAVKDKGICNGEFEINADTFTCSCVSQGENCEEADHERVCRYKVKIMP